MNTSGCFKTSPSKSTLINDMILLGVSPLSAGPVAKEANHSKVGSGRQGGTLKFGTFGLLNLAGNATKKKKKRRGSSKRDGWPDKEKANGMENVRGGNAGGFFFFWGGTRLQICPLYIFGNYPPQMVPRDLHIGFQGLAA